MKIRQIISLLAVLTLVLIGVQPVAAITDDAATIYYNIAEQS
jgi:hypothetical protein